MSHTTRTGKKLWYSYSFLNTYKRCHRRAYLQYIQKAVDSAKVDHRPFIIGLVIDKLFEKWIVRDYPIDYMEENVESLFNWYAQRRHIIFKGTGDQDGLIRRAKGVSRLLQEVAFDERMSERVIEVQKKVIYTGEPNFEGLQFYSRLDLWFPEESIIMDLKVTKQKKYLDVFQLYFFAWIMTKTGEKVTDVAFLVPELSPSIREVEYDLSIAADFELNLLLLLEEAEKEVDWSITASDCWGCPFRYLCEEVDMDSMVVEKQEHGFKIFVGEDVLNEFNSRHGEKAEGVGEKSSRGGSSKKS